MVFYSLLPVVDDNVIITSCVLSVVEGNTINELFYKDVFFYLVIEEKL